MIRLYMILIILGLTFSAQANTQKSTPEKATKLVESGKLKADSAAAKATASSQVIDDMVCVDLQDEEASTKSELKKAISALVNGKMELVKSVSESADIEPDVGSDERCVIVGHLVDATTKK